MSCGPQQHGNRVWPLFSVTKSMGLAFIDYDYFGIVHTLFRGDKKKLAPRAVVYAVVKRVVVWKIRISRLRSRLYIVIINSNCACGGEGLTGQD